MGRVVSLVYNGMGCGPMGRGQRAGDRICFGENGGSVGRLLFATSQPSPSPFWWQSQPPLLCMVPSLQELGFGARTSLQLELLAPANPSLSAAPTAAAAAPQPPAQQQKKKAAAPAPPPPASSAPLPGMFALQFRLTDGEHLRSDFSPEATLREVCSYLDNHRTGGQEGCAGLG